MLDELIKTRRDEFDEIEGKLFKLKNELSERESVAYSEMFKRHEKNIGAIIKKIDELIIFIRKCEG